MRKALRVAICVSRCSISPNISSLLRDGSKYSPAPYTSHRLMIPGGDRRTLLRTAASNLPTGLPSSEATMRMGA